MSPLSPRIREFIDLKYTQKCDKAEIIASMRITSNTYRKYLQIAKTKVSFEITTEFLEHELMEMYQFGDDDIDKMEVMKYLIEIWKYKGKVKPTVTTTEDDKLHEFLQRASSTAPATRPQS